LNDPALRQEIQALLAQGRAIEAIKLCRERTGLGLKEAKDRVDAVAEGRDAEFPAPSPPAAAEFDLLALLKEGRKIEAIQRYRERTGVGLKEAKDAVDALQAREGIIAPARGCLALLGLFLLR
jgi:ribosomal protein L7/L12